MKEKKAQTIIYDSWFLTFKVMSNEDAGKLIKAIGNHVLGFPVSLPENLEEVAEQMLNEIDQTRQAYITKCEQMRANALQKQANAEQMQGKNKNKKKPKPKKKPTTPNGVESGEGSGEPTPAPEETEEEKLRKIIPPKIEWVKAFAESINHPEIDCEHFLDHYTANEWKQSNGNKIKDWQATFRNWVRNEPRFNSTPAAPKNVRQSLEDQIKALEGIDFMGGKNGL